MKLHEFTDRLYAMGGIGQNGKRKRILNEGYKKLKESTDRYGVNVTVDTYFSDEEDLADIEEAARNLNVKVIDVDIYSDDSANITFRGHKEDIIKLFDTELYIDPNDYPELSENAYEEAEDTWDMYESLNESIKIANEVNLNESFSYDFFEKPCSMLHDKLNEDAYDFIDTDPLVQSILKKYPYAFKIPKDERLIIKKEVEKRANEIIDKYRKRITKAFVEQASDYIFGSLNFHELNVTESLYRNNKVEK